MKPMKILRRTVATCMTLALLIVPGVLSGADSGLAGKAGDSKNGAEGCMIAPWDRIDKSVDADGRPIVEYFRAGTLVRRDVSLADGRIEVWIVAADGKTLELSSTFDAPVASDPSTTKYVDEQGRTVVDTYENGFLHTREIIDFDTGEHFITVFDKDGNPIDGKTWTEPSTPVDPNPAYDKVDTYASEDGQSKFADFYKDGTLVRREIYYPDRLEVYVLDAAGNLALDETQGQVYPTATPLPWDDAKKYLDKDGNTVCEYLKDGVTIRREIYFADRVEVYVRDDAGNLVLEPKESQVYPTAAPQAWNDSAKYLDKDGNTIVDSLKDGVVVRREIYKNGGGMEVYELDASGTLVLTVTD